jgi:autotransporter-associated beta strand protein
LDLGGNTQSTSGVITFAGGAVENGTLISNVSAFAAQSGTINASLAGFQGLLKSGSGALTLGGLNRYAGATTLDEGSLLLSGGDDRLPTGAALSLNAGVLDLGGSRQHTSGTITIRGDRHAFLSGSRDHQRGIGWRSGVAQERDRDPDSGRGEQLYRWHHAAGWHAPVCRR